MSIYGNYLTEGFLKNKNRQQLKAIENIINKYIKSINNKFFLDVKINNKSFSQFIHEKSNEFYLEFRSNIINPKIMKNEFNNFSNELEKNISNIQKDIESNISNFKITLKIQKSNLTLKVICKEK